MTRFTLALFLVFLASTIAPKVFTAPIFVRRDPRGDSGLLSRRSPDSAGSGLTLNDDISIFPAVVMDATTAVGDMSAQLHDAKASDSDMVSLLPVSFL
ncbi:hypothetical protein EV361DRAFT_956572 [Lentinula raphanica]|nr:hypothetical protein F5880DRAFT_1618878 [Lentinula raphanica]KAJ3963827.1 hypothetical protein EV361DRAFT_956572 [Lentinula raphanica]